MNDLINQSHVCDDLVQPTITIICAQGRSTIVNTSTTREVDVQVRDYKLSITNKLSLIHGYERKYVRNCDHRIERLMTKTNITLFTIQPGLRLSLNNLIKYVRFCIKLK